MTTGQPWYLNRITKSFNGASEKGVDLGVPYHTPVTPLFPGVVTAVDTGPYGQEVDVAGNLNGQPVTASYVHLDQALVATGQQVSQSSELGVSGGQLAGGFHPASPLYSSGPHIEFSLWPSGTTPYAGRPYNPMSFIQAVQSSQGGLITTLSSGAGSLSMSDAQANAGVAGAYQQALANISSGYGDLLSRLNLGTPNLSTPNLASAIQSGVSGGIQSGLAGVSSDITNGITSGIQNGVTGAASGIGRGLLGAFHVSSLVDLLFRAGLLIVALVLIIVIAQALTAKATQNSVELVSQSKPVQTAKNVLPFVK